MNGFYILYKKEMKIRSILYDCIAARIVAESPENGHCVALCLAWTFEDLKRKACVPPKIFYNKYSMTEY
jgi:hypothetical protein